MNICSDVIRSLNSDIRGKNYYTALDLEKNGETILKLNTGNPATFGFGMPDSVRAALFDKIDSAVGYCDVRGMVPAREAICQYHLSRGLTNFSMDDIFVGNGVSEIASMISTAILNPGDEVLLPLPCYSLWVNEVLLHQAVPVFYRCDESCGWNPDTDHMKRLITPKTKAIVVINPNNPTGVVYDNGTLLRIAEIARENKLVVLSDEIYDRLIFDEKPYSSFASLAPDIPVVTMNGLSKSHCLCGFRCGWLVTSGPEAAREQISQALLKLASIRLSANAMMQTIIPAALADTEYTQRMIGPEGRLNLQRQATFAELDKLDCISYVKNDASFYIFPRIKPEFVKYKDDREFAHQLLLNKHILIVPGSGFSWPDPDHFRIVMLPQPGELSQAVRQMGEFINDCR
jgi:alanine-synthesizing transaminase